MTQVKSEVMNEYVNLQAAFIFFNGKLFFGELPEVFITLSRKRGARGYFWEKQFLARMEENASLHEISLNPEHFNGRSDKEILSTLVHEMAHLWQAEFGLKKPRKAYHNREWADKMLEFDLPPSRTGLSPMQEYEKVRNLRSLDEASEAASRLKAEMFNMKRPETGQSMSHYIRENGFFDKACDELLATGWHVQWESFTKPPKGGKKDKVKYECKPCFIRAWAKPGVKLVCGECGSALKAKDE